ncbi:beta-N-acetylhexosaminidase [Parapedobacter defluvii]|uniref:beta-N-acetylhexosaminidase n=1 Tax=Parapedobacter defluvii TaxID=2045106 RepID=A0ABQ1LIW3_9SPHI|nr:family 20 glycosylhydrolase [Parapedobacter defluvii]GGC24041.1 beta-N-acetylhexosaminidase [Parapedobacter defluvii]
MIKLTRLAVAVALLLSTNLYAQSEVSIIPQPLQLEQKQGAYVLTEKAFIQVDNGNTELKALGELLVQGLFERTGTRLSLVPSRADNGTTATIVLQLVSDTLLGDEGYRLSVSEKGIIAQARKANGLFYAIQSIYQLLPVERTTDSGVAIPAVEITDKPRFGWRGLMLDVGRYFYSVDYIKKYIDYLAMHKMNVFHWHLVEDHGWRIEIKKYPQLTDVSAWRPSTNFQRGSYINLNPHGGFYTQEQVKEVVAYAQSRYVTVVPEIELPGHVLSALVAYPELSCTGGPFEIPEQWAIQKDIYCAGKEEVFTFLEGVLGEVAELFPSEIIHIGGDEAPKDRWEACPHCQKRIKDEGLKDEHELQSYFITRIEKFLNSKGKRIIGWDEILEGGLAPNAAVMSWRGTEGGIEAARMHHPVVMTPTTYMYLDYFQGEPYLEPSGIGGFLPLRKVYSFEPIPEELVGKEREFILGVQGNIWCEYIHAPEKVDYMTYPRGAAVAEIGWSTPDRKDWVDFTRRLETQYTRYEQMGINYAQSAYQVYFEVTDDTVGKKSTVTLKTDSYQPEIHYTLDGTEPSAKSPSYEGAFEVPQYTTVRAATFKNGKRVSPVSIRSMVHFGETE